MPTLHNPQDADATATRASGGQRSRRRNKNRGNGQRATAQDGTTPAIEIEAKREQAAQGEAIDTGRNSATTRRPEPVHEQRKSPPNHGNQHGIQDSLVVHGHANRHRQNNTAYQNEQRGSAAAQRSVGGRSNAWNRPNRDVFIPLQDSIDFVNQIAEVQVPSRRISWDELVGKENFRSHLQHISRLVINFLGREVGVEIEPTTVRLMCYGSLRSGFALKGSDMDLAFVSPLTESDPRFDAIKIYRTLQLALLKSGHGARLLSRTRVPILKVCESPSPELLSNLSAECLQWMEQQTESKQEMDQKEPADGQVDHRRSDKGDENGSDESKSSTRDHQDGLSPTSAQLERKDEDASLPQGLRGRSDEELIRLFTLAINEGWYSYKDRIIIASFEDCHTKAYGNENDPDLVCARMNLRQLPDILSKYREPKNNGLDFPKDTVGIQCDINYSNPLAMHNTHLLRCYSICDPRIEQMGIFVKAWAKTRDINHPYNGTLSSYGYILMVIHYAINVANPPLAPNLQLVLDASRRTNPEEPRECNGFNVQFWRDEQEINFARQSGHLTSNIETLGSLLRGFFLYYGDKGGHVPHACFNWAREVISLRTRGGILTKEEKGWTGAKTEKKEGEEGERPIEVRQRYLLAIEDPFEITHNVARPVVHDGIVAIRDEFRLASRIIKCGGLVGGAELDLFAEYKHVELERGTKYFTGKAGANGKPYSSGPKPEEAANARSRHSKNHSRSGEPEFAVRPGPSNSGALHVQALRESAGLPDDEAIVHATREMALR